MAIDDNTSYELTGAQVKDLASKINAKEDSANLATVATSGSYTDLLNQPTIPAAQVNSDWSANSGVAQILNKPSLATVATSGSYTDLTNKPTIPTVNDATLTITQNGTSAGTFTANASSNTTIALTDTTYSAFTGATSSVAGSAGLVPAPTTSDPDKFLKGDGTWATPNAGGVFDCYVNNTLSGSWTGFWNIYDSTSYTTQLDSADISNQLLAGKRVIVHTSDATPYTFEIISQFDDSLPCYDFIVSFNGVLKKLHYIKLFGWQFTEDVVNDATLTIQHNGTTVDTFTANASANKTVNIETIYADTITPTTAVPPITTDQIQDAAVTNAKINWGTTVEEVSISDFITMESGFSIATNESYVYKIGKLVVAHIIVQSTNNYTSTQTVVGTIKTAYRPAHQINAFAGLGSNQWNIAGTICYCYIEGGDSQGTPGATIIADQQNSSKKWAKVSLTWVTA